LERESAHLSFSCHLQTSRKLFRPPELGVLEDVGELEGRVGFENKRNRLELAMIDALTTGYGMRYRRKTTRAGSPVAERSDAIIEPMSLEQLLDEELVAQYRSTTEAGQRDQYINELFRRNYARVGRWCLRFTDNRESAADLAQEIFTKAYQKLASFEGQSKFTTWLFVIARNHCLNAVRANARQATELAEDNGDEILMEIPDQAETPYSVAERDSSAKLVRSLLAEALDETEKVVFTLHYGDDVPLDAITRLLRLDNQSGAKAYIVSAKRKLARLAQQWKARGQYKGL
jgi:RNA polymerase sigma-70 factor (ECF subfamily)